MQDANLDVQQAPGAMYAPEATPQADLDPRAWEVTTPGVAVGASTATAVPELQPGVTTGASSKAAPPINIQLAQNKMPAPGEKDSTLAGSAAGDGGGEGSGAQPATDKLVEPRMQGDGHQSDAGDSVDSGSSDDVVDEDDGVSDGIPDGASESAILAPQPSNLSDENGTGGVRATSLWWESLLRKTQSQGDSVLKREPSRGFSRGNTADDMLCEGPADSSRRSHSNLMRTSDSESSVNPAWKAMSDLAGADNELAAVLVRRKLIAEGALR